MKGWIKWCNNAAPTLELLNILFIEAINVDTI